MIPVLSCRRRIRNPLGRASAASVVSISSRGWEIERRGVNKVSILTYTYRCNLTVDHDVAEREHGEALYYLRPNM